MNKTHLQLTLHHYMSCSCWDTLVLHVGMQRFLSQRVETVELAFYCWMVSTWKLGGVCMGMRLLRLCAAKSLQQGITCSIVPRPPQIRLFYHLQHLWEFYIHKLLMEANRSRDLKVFLVASVCCCCCCCCCRRCSGQKNECMDKIHCYEFCLFLLLRAKNWCCL